MPLDAETHVERRSAALAGQVRAHDPIREAGTESPPVRLMRDHDRLRPTLLVDRGDGDRRDSSERRDAGDDHDRKLDLLVSREGSEHAPMIVGTADGLIPALTRNFSSDVSRF